MANREYKGILLIEQTNPDGTPRQADSPIWIGEDPNGTHILLGANLSATPPIFTAIVRAELGCPGSAAEGPTDLAALSQAFAGYATVQSSGPRTRDLTPADRARVAAVASRVDSLSEIARER